MALFNSSEFAEAVVSGGLTAASGSGTPAAGSVTSQLGLFKPGVINVSIWGTFTATVVLEKSYDAGATWLPVQTDLAGTALSFAGSGAFNRHIQIEEAETGMMYRFRCTAYTSGTAICRASQG